MPSCGRITRTLPRGACAECWQPKTPDARPVLRPKPAATTPLVDLEDIPDWVWIIGAAALGTGIVGALAVLL